MKFTILFCLSAFSMKLQAAIDTLQLPEIIVKEIGVPSYAFGRNVVHLDTAYLSYFHTDLVNALENYGVGYTKSYGPGNSAIFSNQGTGPQHNQIVWNGIPINNSLLGLSDVSLLKLGEGMSVDFIQGTSAGYWGSGAIGSTLLFNTVLDNTDHFSVGSSFNSMLNTQYDASFSKQIHSWKMKADYSYAKGRNSFNIENYTLPSKETQKIESPTESNIAQVSIGKDFNNYGKFQSNWYFSDFRRNLSASLTEKPSQSIQKDRQLRGTLDWDFKLRKWKIELLTGLTNDIIRYQDVSVNDTGRVSALLTRLEASRAFSKLLVNIQAQSKWEQAENSSYKAKVTRNISSAILGITYAISRSVVTNIESRAEFNTVGKSVAILSGGIEVNWGKINAKTYASGSYNQPSLNDLYWVPGGNSSLKPENGINAGLSLGFPWKLWKVSAISRIETFYHNIDNWIQWIPGSAYWSPVNYKTVESQGITVNQNFTLKQQNAQWRLHLGGTYTSAKNIDNKTSSSYLKQLAYVPFITGNASLEYLVKSFKFRLSTNYVGARFTVFDESESLKAYQIVNLDFDYFINVKSNKINLFCQFNNLFNTYYETVAYRPRASRNVTVGFKFNLL